MDCRELRDRIRDQLPLGPEVDGHVQACEPCQQLVAERGALGAVLALDSAGAEVTGGFDDRTESRRDLGVYVAPS